MRAVGRVRGSFGQVVRRGKVGCAEMLGGRGQLRGWTEKREKKQPGIGLRNTENVRRFTGYSAAICLTVGLSNELRMRRNLTGGLPTL